MCYNVCTSSLNLRLILNNNSTRNEHNLKPHLCTTTTRWIRKSRVSLDSLKIRNLDLSSSTFRIYIRFAPSPYFRILDVLERSYPFKSVPFSELERTAWSQISIKTFSTRKQTFGKTRFSPGRGPRIGSETQFWHIGKSKLRFGRDNGPPAISG